MNSNNNFQLQVAINGASELAKTKNKIKNKYSKVDLSGNDMAVLFNIE